MFQDMAFAVLKYFPHVIFCSSSFHRRGGFSSRYSTSISCVHWGCMTGVFTFISSVNMQECEDYAKMGFWLLLCSFHDKKKEEKSMSISRRFYSASSLSETRLRYDAAHNFAKVLPSSVDMSFVLHIFFYTNYSLFSCKHWKENEREEVGKKDFILLTIFRYLISFFFFKRSKKSYPPSPTFSYVFTTLLATTLFLFNLALQQMWPLLLYSTGSIWEAL